MRSKLALRNILMSTGAIFVSIVIGLVVPRYILSYYGSEVNGLVSSINQFLNYITILESGVGAVVVTCLYKPLAENDYKKINQIISKSRRFFLGIVGVYLVYVVVLAILYPLVTETSFKHVYVSMMVLVLGITLFVQYCFTINYSLILQAAQRYYVASFTSMLLQIINAIVSVVLIVLHADILWVKLVSSLIFVLNPVILSIYVRKIIPGLSFNEKSDFVIPQKRDTLVHNLTYVIHNNTDIVMITLFLGVRMVSIYSVYNMVISSLRRLLESFSSGTQSAFGDMIARDQFENLKKSFYRFECLVQIITTIVFTVTAVMLVPFVLLYTKGVTDISYNVPLFSYVMVLAEAIYIFRLPYHTLVKASASFKDTRNSAIIEAGLNIFITIILINIIGLPGAAFGTLFAMLYRTVYYIIYFRNKYIDLNVGKTLRRICTNIIFGVGICILFKGIAIRYCDSAISWVLCSAMVLMVTTVIVSFGNYILFKNEFISVLRYAMEKIRKNGER